MEEAATYVYLLNKVLHSVDWFYEIELPINFCAEHPMSSVLGRAKYGNYFWIYQGVTVGGNRKGDNINYPVIGENVLLYANCTIIGNSHIGNNVIVSANSYIKDTDIPNNCLVFGQTPNLIIKEKTENEIRCLNKNWFIGNEV